MAKNPFVQEIDFKEIELLEVVGKGSYGTVRKGKWHNIDVAVKIIETDQEKKAFIVEVNQLSRVDHVNIVKLYGACTKVPVCLVMEYAEGGSLYKVLHCMKQVEYTAAHALSWMLQTANGVVYLHNMKPRPLIHRDLKPPNLLLINGGTVLKICDFGTACDKHTYMTNSKGSAAWMAPEVFEGSQYSEKCDVFSWGIILWEVLTREKPFCDGEGATAFRIMWAVHCGKRPPLIQGCPRALESLLTRCWAKNPKIRPSMTVVQNELSSILKYMKGADVPIVFSEIQVSTETNIKAETSSNLTAEPMRIDSASSGSKTFLPDQSAEISSPSDMFLSVEPIGEKYAKDMKKRKSADFTSVEAKCPQSQKGHRRTGSYDSPIVKTSDSRPPDNCVQSINKFSEEPEQVYKDGVRNFVPGIPVTDGRFANQYFSLLEPKLQPLPPVQHPESIEIYQKHINLARELFRYQEEIKKLTERKNELLEELNVADKSSTYIDEFIHLTKEKEGLLQLRTNLKRQLKAIREKQSGDNTGRSNRDDWVVV